MRYRILKYAACTAIAILLFSNVIVEAQEVDQVIELEPGWNSVYLEVQPEPRRCEILFDSQGVPVESVWMWNPTTSSEQFVDVPPDPCSLSPGHRQWLVYFPQGRPEHIASNLFNIIGGRTFLIKLGGGQNVTWQVRGRPRLPKISWQPNSYNLVGFHVSGPGAPGPLFQDFFSCSSAHVNAVQNFHQPAYRLNNQTGQWDSFDPGTTQIEHGKAYWVYAKAASEFTGPLTVEVDNGEGLDFGQIMVRQSLILKNKYERELTVDITPLASPVSPDPNVVTADSVPLMYYDPNVGWVDMADTLSRPMEALSTRTVPLAVNRRDPNMEPEETYQSVLEVSNGEGVRIFVPATAESADSAGLWVGTVGVSKVSQIIGGDANDPNIPATATEFQFRLILHVDPNNTVQLLREVIEMWKEPVMEEDPNTGYNVVVEPGRFVLLTDESLKSQFTGTSLRDGQVRGRRISSSNFSFKGVNNEGRLQMDGTFAIGETLEAMVITDANDPLNPFGHRYHPDHDENDEIYRITRDITLTLTPVDPLSGEEPPGWGYTDIGGTYHEQITGLFRDTEANVPIDVPIVTEGVFSLHRVSYVSVLNDGRN